MSGPAAAAPPAKLPAERRHRPTALSRLSMGRCLPAGPRRACLIITLTIVVCAGPCLTGCSGRAAVSHVSGADQDERPRAGQQAGQQAERPLAGGRPILRLTFLGDIMAHDVNFNRPPYDPIWETVDGYLRDDDITFANLEFPIAPDRPLSGYPAFNGPFEYAAAAGNAGVDCFSLANNHANDQGPAGVRATRAALNAAEPLFRFSGTRSVPEEPFGAEILETVGWRVGFISGTQFLNGPWGEELVRVVSPADATTVDEFLSEIRALAAETDMVIVSFHGGTEYRRDPGKQIEDFYEKLIAAGADIVWGHHPHVLQPWETVRHEGRFGLIIYSAGNVISGQRWRMDPRYPDPERVDTGDSALFSVRVAWTGAGASVCGVSPVPITNYRDPRHGMVVLPLEAALGLERIPGDWKEFFIRRAGVIGTRLAPLDVRNIPEEP